MDDVEISEPLDSQIGASLQAAQIAPVNEKLGHLKKTEELLLDREGGAHLIDNFLDEMLQFAASPNPAIKCFVLSFIEKACKKDAEVLRKAVLTISYFLMDENEGRNVQVVKKAMLTYTNIYSIALRWAVSRKTDSDVEQCWDRFSALKARVMFHIDSDNEGIRTRAIKFLEMVVVAQSNKTEQSEVNSKHLMNIGEIPRDHRYISFRKMLSESQHSMQSLIDQTTLPHISSQNLLTVMAAICNIARQRPEFLSRVVGAIDVLQVNLPPTLGTSQVKAVRKELKMHLLRLMKHPAVVPHAQKIATLLSDLGTSQAEIQKVMPAEAKRKQSAPLKEEEPAMKKRRDQPSSNALDDDDDEEEDDVADKITMDSAIDVTQNFIFSRLNHRIVTNLVIISLATLPDVMPPAFQSTFTPIASAGSDNQRQRLARMMAAQATSMGVGPGAEMVKRQKLEALKERAVARNEGAIIPPTPAHFAKTETGKPPVKRVPAKVNVILPPPMAPPTSKTKVQMNIVTNCKEMSKEEREKLFILTLDRLMQSEKRAQQGGAAMAQHKILVRLVSRFYEKNDHLEEKLVNFIIEQHKSRSELALLWVSEMYAQYHGFSLCFAKSHTDGKLTQGERLVRYNKVLVLLLRSLFERELHKETLFHKILLEAPLLTPDALSFLKLACVDSVFGAFAITTLRELVLTRCRQRSELLQLLFHLTFYERVEVRSQSVETVKELFELPYMRECVREEVERQLEDCTKDIPPEHFFTEDSQRVWKASVYKAALTLPMATLSHDHSLIHLVARVFAKSSSNDFKLTIMRHIESAVKAMGQSSEELLRLLEECPQGAESLVARIVHLLTERAPATPEIVHRLKKLHDTRHTDVRSLLPILPGLAKEDILHLLPKFVINATMAKSFGQAVKRILSAKNSESGQFSLSPTELIVEYHKIDAKTTEEKKLLREHVRTLMTAHRSMTKEVISSGIEELLRETPVPLLLFHTIVVVYELHNPLHAFLSNVLHKLITRDLWKETEEYERDFIAALVAMPDISYQVALTNLDLDDLKKVMDSTKEDVPALLRAALPTLSTHQQRSVSDGVLSVMGVKERPCDIRDREREKDRKERDERREKERDRDGRERRGGERRERDEKRDKERSSRRSYAIGDR